MSEPARSAAALLPPIFVISLPRTPERREHIAGQLTALGVSWEFIEAVDGATPPSETVTSAPALGRALTGGEIACAMSHQRCYQRICDRTLPMAFILEDDVEVTAEFVAVASAIARFPADWELVLFAHHSARYGADRGAATSWRGTTIHPRHRVARVAEFAMGAMAYLVTRDGAAKLLAHGTPVRMPADWLTGYAPSAGVRSYAITPPVVTSHPSVAHTTTIPGRAGGSTGARIVGRPRLRGPLRSWAGTAWLWMRQAGIGTDTFSRRY